MKNIFKNIISIFCFLFVLSSSLFCMDVCSEPSDLSSDLEFCDDKYIFLFEDGQFCRKIDGLSEEEEKCCEEFIRSITIANLEKFNSCIKEFPEVFRVVSSFSRNNILHDVSNLITFFDTKFYWESDPNPRNMIIKEIIKLFNNANIPLNIKNKAGLTPLNKALYDGHFKIAYEFLNAGMNLLDLDNEDGTFLYNFVDGIYREDLFKEQRLCVDGIWYKTTRFEYFLKMAYDLDKNIVNHQDKYGDTVMHFLAGKDFFPHKEKLLERDVRYKERIINEVKLMIDCLLKYGADLNIKNEDGDTAISIASREFPEIYDYLFEKVCGGSDRSVVEILFKIFSDDQSQSKERTKHSNSEKRVRFNIGDTGKVKKKSSKQFGPRAFKTSRQVSSDGKINFIWHVFEAQGMSNIK